MLQIKNISKTYKTGNFIQKALKNVSLNLRDNEFVAILGPSGSGKTTLLNIIGGLDRYDEGDLIINHVSTSKYNDKDFDAYRNHTIGFVFQSYNLIPHQTILTNVELALTIGGVSKKERKARALKALDEVGLKDQAHKRPNQLSGGQMQRVAIARALVNNPDIVLADEPTGALDSQTSIQVMDLLSEVAKNRLVVMVTHNPELAHQYATRIVKLKDGEIISDTNPYFVEDQQVKKKKKRLGKAHMSIFTALSLSFNNLLTKKGRTILTAFAGSIGIIGIALILSLSQGFQNYIDKIQEDTMTSYPLTIQSDTADIFSALLSMRIDSDEEIKEDEVREIQLVSSMMNSVGTNDLKSFKKYLEDNEDLYKDDVNKIAYAYSVSPRIYTIDATNTLTQLNPSTIMSSFYSDSMASAFTSLSSAGSGGAFSQVDFSVLEENYGLLKGRYPSKYNEVLLVLPKENQISDLLVYMLGLRDSKELKTLLQQAMNYEEVTVEHEPMVLSYDDLMNIELKLINSSDLYKYNTTYDTYEDMSDDDDYMLNVYNNSEDLIITGIAYSLDDTSTGGILYSKQLKDYVIETAKHTEIVQKQLKNKDIDVFSGNRFDEEEKKQELDFEDMVSVDEDMIKDAFKVNISEDDFKFDFDKDKLASSVQDATLAACKNLVVDTTLAKQSVNVVNGGILLDMFGKYYAEIMGGPVFDVSTYFDTSETFIGAMANFAMMTNFSNNAKTFITALYNYTIPANMVAFGTLAATIDPNDPSTINTALDEYIATFLATLPDDNDAKIAYNLQVAEVVKYSNATMIGQFIGKAVGETSEMFVDAMSGLTDLFGDDVMEVDTDKFAQAFTFDMDEDELSRLMSSLITGSTASYRNNLVNLGYQDVDEPTSISFYFNDFDSKERFLDLLDSYNDNVNDDDMKIKYADITGLLMGSVKKIIDSVSYVLIAFVSISLVVSSIMIAVITLISVMERTKEIGILRAMGASKLNVSSIFNAETFIIGLLSGLMGVGVTFLSIPPINNLIHNLTDNYDINAVLPMNYAIILVFISVFLTIIAGIIPSRKASKQDPVIALRSE